MKPASIKYCCWIGIFLIFSLSACQGNTSVFNPQGEGAEHIANLWVVMLIVGAIVYVQVVAFLALALFRQRRGQHSDNDPPDVSPPSRNTRTFIIVNGIAIPAAILTVIFGFNLVTLAALSPANTTPQLIVEVIGHRWWWEVRYPHHNIVTANEINIPTGTQVELRLSSEDVIHSLWIPSLNGKTDLIPGQSNTMSLYTDQVGVYRGICAELCGIQHARMHLYVIAQPQDDFNEWVANQQQVAPQPQDEMILHGQQIFLGASCVYCHTVRGTSASGVIGPDLTHFASRQTLGAGTLANTPGNLAGWVIDPQAIKPGNLMPPMYLESDDLQALLAYLETLH